MSGRVSVIIPVYNAEEYLGACVSGVLSQTYKNTEIILVDDGSTDKSGEMCDSYAASDDRVKVIHKQNGGASSARNAGLREASGEYVYFVDSDDRTVPELIEKLLGSAEENGSELVFFDAYAVDGDTGAVSKTNYGHKEVYSPDAGASLMKRMVANRDFHVGVWQLFYKKAFLDRTGLDFLEGVIYEDYLFACKAYCLAGKVSYVPEFLYYRQYRKNSVMTSKKTMKNFVSADAVYRAVRDFSDEYGGVVPDAYLARGAYNAITCYEALSKDEKSEAAGRFRELKQDILSRGAFGDTALRARCYGKGLWAAARAVQKLIAKQG